MKNAARQETELTRMPPTSGPRMDVAAEEPAQMPNARPCSSPSKLAVMMDNEAGTTALQRLPGGCGTESAAPCSAPGRTGAR